MPNMPEASTTGAATAPAARVLLVDDSRLARMTIRAVVGALYPHWEIVEAENVDQALRTIESRAFQIVFVDIGLPGRSGLELAADLRNRHPAVSLAVVTANVQDAVRDRVQAIGATYITKPIRPLSLVSFLCEAEAKLA